MNDTGTRKERPKSIDEALRVLDEALANPAADLKNIVTDEIQSLQSVIGKSSSQVTQVIGDLASSLSAKFGPQLQDLASNIGDVTGESAQKFQAMAEQGVAMGRDAARRADEEVRANPWPYIGGIAIGTFALGCLLGSKLKVSEPNSNRESDLDAAADAPPESSNLN